REGVLCCPFPRGASACIGSVMAKESRKLKRTPSRRPSSGEVGANVAEQAAATQMLNAEATRSMMVRLGLITLAVWVVCGSIALITQSDLGRNIALGVAIVLTGTLVGIGVWAARRAKSAQGVAGILANIKTDDDRAAA